MKEPIQSHFYGEWNEAQRARRMAAQARAYKKAGINQAKAKRGKQFPEGAKE